MKRLFLLRHAQALPADTGRDKDRALSPRGIEDAKLLGQAMRARKLLPDLILCSDAKRTTQTCQALSEQLEHNVTAIYQKTMYDASRGDLFAMIQGAENDVNGLMLIGHNPAMYELSAMLASEGAPALLGRLDFGYPPATLSVFELPITKWDGIDPDQSTLVEFLTSTDYNAPSPSRWN